MKKLSIGVCLLSTVFAAHTAIAGEFPKTKVGLEVCVAAALKEKAGEIVKLELKLEKKVPVYEFDINSPDGTEWDVECNALTGKIVEVEQEVASADHPLFKAKAKVSEADARKTALTAYPGEIIEVEYEIEADGAATYEFDIKGKDGKEIKVEVDAASGKIVEAHPEVFQIGKE
ncbi:MAG: PepSY domain-containing protein [Methylophilaceae bacterium]